MSLLIIIIFIFGYTAITLEYPLRISKTVSALITGVLCWVIYLADNGAATEVNSRLSSHLEEISGIIFFLIGAMTIVEVIDAHKGFALVTEKIKTTNPKKLLWIISFITFFLSAVLDNLTTSIVMVTLLRKLISDKKMRLLFAGIVILGANAGGAWSPIGDVTTTMLWISGRISSFNIIKILFLPSLISLIIPAAYVSLMLKEKQIEKPAVKNEPHIRGSRIILFTGIGALIFVPVFKALTGLPPYLGMLFGLAILWLVSEMIHYNKTEDEKLPFSTPSALSRIDISSILFFLGILISIAALEASGILSGLAIWMDNTIGNKDIIVTIIGLLSAIIDNVPLVAASLSMYSLTDFPIDHKIWEFIAYCAGTGGSILIIGSAAGVAVMGMEKIDFFWYLKKMSIPALIGYFAGIGAYLILYNAGA
jgi:Na+/H+ antiporter NhaD/arsenite permease-like protein